MKVSTKGQKQAPHFPKAPRLKFEVTAEEIEKAALKNSGHCMTADAVKVKYPWAQSISVDIQTIRLTDPRPGRGLRYIYLTPHVVAEHILKWDYGVKPKPFSVELRGENAHVVSAGNRVAKLGHGGQTSKLPKKATLVKVGSGVTNVPRRVGGREPTNYSVRREFGLRAFKGMTGVNVTAE